MLQPYLDKNVETRTQRIENILIKILRDICGFCSTVIQVFITKKHTTFKKSRTETNSDD